MYTLAAANPKAVLGYSLWCGFNDSHTYKLRDPAFQSFEDFEVSTFQVTIPKLEFAMKEAARLNAHIAEYCDTKCTLFVLPLSVYLHQLEMWAHQPHSGAAQPSVG